MCSSSQRIDDINDNNPLLLRKEESDQSHDVDLLTKLKRDLDIFEWKRVKYQNDKVVYGREEILRGLKSSIEETKLQIKKINDKYK